MRIGIMGGTFNPPHKGHINAALCAKEQIPLDKLIFIPTGTPPHKEMTKDSASSAERLEMTKLAAKSIGAEVSDIEIKRKGKSFTADTLREMKSKYPDDELWLIMGTDMFLTIENWKEPEVIFKLANIGAVPRNDEDVPILKEHGKMLSEKYGVVSAIIDVKALTVSSTEIRPLIKSGKISEYLTAEIYDYILENNLYGISGSDKV